MALSLTSLRDLDALGFEEVIDVRSPSEYAEDHLPCAVNLPVLDDDERARIGTIYVRDSRFKARRAGAALVARNAAAHLEGHLADKGPGYRPLVYCWRGGQRSGSFATILAQIGWRVEVLEGGYRSYRRLVQEALYQTPLAARVLLLDGNTGTAKTELLARLDGLGQQVIDLEALANHRGSIFGRRSGGQPSQKAFESALAARVVRLDPGRALLLEAESSKIGGLSVPPSLWRAMQAAKRIEVTAPLPARAAYLARVYGTPAEATGGFAAALEKLRVFHAAEVISDWQALLARGAHAALAERLMAEHYDPRYAKSRARKAGIVERIAMPDLSPQALDAAAARIAAIAARASA